MAAETPAIVTNKNSRDQDWLRVMSRMLRKWGTIIAMVLVGVGFTLATPYFLTISNITNVIFGMVTSALVALGLTYVVIAGSFDLSIGLVVTTSSIVTAMAMPELGAIGACIIAILVASAIGLFNGWLVTYGRLSGIVVTLGTMFILGGLNQYLTGGYQISIPSANTGFLNMGQGDIVGIPIADLILLGVFVIGHVVATKTRIGHYVSAVGDNPMAAYYSGIKVYRWVIVAFVLSAVMSGIGGIMQTAVSSSAQPVGGEGYLLDAFAAVFLGATVLGRGRPHLFGTLVAALFLNFVTAGMNMVGAPFSLHELIEGGVLIAAVGANALLNREELHMKFI